MVTDGGPDDDWYEHKKIASHGQALVSGMKMHRLSDGLHPSIDNALSLASMQRLQVEQQAERHKSLKTMTDVKSKLS